MSDLSIMNALAVPSAEIVTLIGGQAVTTTPAIAQGTGVDHASVIKLVRTYRTDLEEFGGVGFEIQPFETAGGSQQREIAVLNEQQATLVMTYMRNSDIVREFKKRLVKAFWEMKNQNTSRPMSQLEVLAASAQALVMIERQQQALMAAQQQHSASLAKLEATVAASSVWDHCPQNCEPITKIRGRMLKQYGLPAWVVDMVMRELPLSPKVHGMVRNGHEEANGNHYEVWAVADVTRTFRRFVGDCKQETPHFASHPDIDRRFHIKAGLLNGGAA